jgi:uncharacterized protein (TIGR03083 family)
LALSPLTPVDTRHFFRPVSSALVALLRGLTAEDFQKPTIAGTWSVRDVLAHLVDLTFRRVSFHRDRLVPPPPPFPIESEQDFVRFINRLNHEWVAATGRFSPQVLTELFELASADLATFFETLPRDAPALFGVSWAGERTSEGWFDIGREFTELWHHQMQIRLAVGARPLDAPRYLHAVLEVAVRGLPHAYRDVPANEGETVAIEADGAAGGRWTLVKERQRWMLWAGTDSGATTRVRLSDDAAWRLLFNALPPSQAPAAISIDGRNELATPLIRARSVVV